MSSHKRQYANHFEYPDKRIKELGIVCEWVELLEGEYRAPSCGPHPNWAPDCLAKDRKGRTVAVEVCELVDREAVEENIAGRRIYRAYGREDFLAGVAGILRKKDAKDYHGSYSKIIVLIHTDEPDLSFERCEEWLSGQVFDGLERIREAYLIFSYDPSIKRYSLIKINISSYTFREKVFRIVRKIPKGRTMTYKEVAEKAGRPKAYRAVGNILHTNYDPEVPCHRVVRSDGKPGGWNRGARKKAEILKKEKMEI